MVKKILILLGLAFLVLPAACERTYENQLNVDGINIMLKADRYPLIKGNNQLAVILIGALQKTVTDAKVQARFYKPDLSASPVPESKTEAVLTGDKYFFTVTPTLEGIWKLDLTVTEPGQHPSRASFGIEVQ